MERTRTGWTVVVVVVVVVETTARAVARRTLEAAWSAALPHPKSYRYRCSGFLTRHPLLMCFFKVFFVSKEGMQNALAQRTMHLSRKQIKISPYLSKEERERGEGINICHAWTEFRCRHGDSCCFSHDGTGGVEKASAPYQGRHFQCLSYRKKGKCSKGDACQFLHIKGETRAAKSEAGKATAEVVEDGESPKKKGICNTFVKKGKCRKGDKCKYLHTENKRVAVSEAAQDTGIRKKRKIDGSFLVEMRTGTKTTFD